MSQSVITSAFAEWKAKQAVDNKPVVLDEFVLAFISDLDITNPIDPGEGLPPAEQIVHRQAVSKSGVVNQNGVVYSVVMGADIGDFDFNWIGIINKASGIVATIIHAPAQRKIKNNSGQQGNVLTRSILMEYNGARTETQIEVPAETWQIDFTARLAAMDERQRVENVDIYGPAAFFGNGFLVTKNDTAYCITAGIGYVAGLRAQLSVASHVVVEKNPAKVWVDVAWKGTLTSVWNVDSVITVAEKLVDYVEDGQQHYVFAVASIDAAGNVTDLRPKGSLSDQSGASAYARKDKNLSDLNSIPKARETLKLKGAALLDVGTVKGSVAAGDDPRIVTAVPDTRKINGLALNKDITLLPSNVGAVPDTRRINGHQLNADFSISAVDVNAIPDGTSGSGSNAPAWNARSGLYVLQSGSASQMLFHLNCGVGSTRAVQFKVDYKNRGIWYRSSRDGFGFEADWSEFLTHTGSLNINGTLRSSAEYQSTHSDNYRIVCGGYGTFWRNDGIRLYLMITKKDDRFGSWGTLRPFSILLASGQVSVGHGFAATGPITSNSTITPGNYSNFDARYVSGVRLGARGQIITDGAMTEAPSGCVITGGNGNEGSQIGLMYYRPLQQLINGAWVTVAYT